MSGIYGQFAKKKKAAWGTVARGNKVRHLYMELIGFKSREDTFADGRRFWEEITNRFVSSTFVYIVFKFSF